MQLRIYNTLTKQKELFEPRIEGAISLYVCGVTVYDYSHVGHARVYVFFDVVQRALRAMGYHVRYVRNFTDVDDKIIRRALENREDCGSLTTRFIAAFHDDMRALDCEDPDVEPLVTTHIPEIVEMIEQIVARGHAYVVPSEYASTDSTATNHDVYFDVARFPAYGALSGRSQDDNQDGASDRVSHDARKRSQADFALWKAAKPGEPQWDSPWGKGRPGWHIECSAMSCKHLGQDFDLHGGGKDLIFPHHDNEIAQSKAANGGGFAHGWMHLGFLTIDSEKMSKSLGNFFTIRDVLARFHPQALRFFLLTTHYLHPQNFSDKALEEATRRVLGVYEKLAAADAVLAGRQPTGNGVLVPTIGEEPSLVTESRRELLEALADDFSTPRALAALSEPMNALGAALLKPKAAGNLEIISHVRALAAQAGQLLGVFQHDPATIVAQILEGARQRLFPQGSDTLEQVEALLQARAQARLDKDWGRADELRGQLAQLGVEIRDSKDGSTWRPLLAEVGA